MQDRTIDNALLALRKQIILGDGKGREHVEALLRLRGVPITPRRPWKADVAKRGHMRWMVLDALRDGGKTLPQITDYVDERRPELSRRAAYVRSGQCLAKLKKAGLVRREGRVWISN